MKTFKEHTNDDLEEAFSRPNWVKSISVIIQTRVANLGRQVRSEDDLKKKVDLLSHQIKWSTAASVLGVATDLDDKSVMKGIRK